MVDAGADSGSVRWDRSYKLTTVSLAGYTGVLGIRLFDEQATVWDYNRGRALPEVYQPEPTDIAALDKLGMGLRESKWRMSTRTLYNGFFRAWLAFALVNGCVVLPAARKWIVRWLTYMALQFTESISNRC